jgi:hypothetical protein
MDIQGSVGRNARNNSVDVRTVQILLQQNMRYLIPAAPVVPSGICDSQTVLLISLFQARVVGMPAPTGVIERNSRTLFGLNGQSGPATVSDPMLQEALDSLRSEVLNFSRRFIQDSGVRADYVAQAEKVSREILEGVEKGELTPGEAAIQAHSMRNGLLDSARLKNSDIGRAVSEAEKASGLTIEELLAKYSQEIFKKDFSALGAAEQDAVFLQVVRAAGRPNPRFTALATKLGTAGKGLLIISVSLAVYTVATSERPGREAARQGAGAGVGFLGSLAGGAIAGLACGPGAPICVGVGVFVGGLVFALGSDFAFDEIWE